MAALLLYAGLWTDLGSGYLSDSGRDQTLFEWFLAVQADAVRHGGDPFFSALQNFPLGVNLMANTPVPGLALPLAPLTWLAGPTATWALILTGGLAATGCCWYWVLSRHVVASRPAAVIGGAFCALAPPVISHAHAHPNFTALFCIPLIVRQLLLLAEGDRVGRRGALLGLLVAWQAMIGEEPLLIAATAMAVWAVGFAIARRDAARRAARGLLAGIGIAAPLAAVLLAYPLLRQFLGAQSYRGLEHGSAGNDLTAMAGFSRASLAGRAAQSQSLAMNPTEENAYFGWPLLVIAVVLAIWLWRAVPARLAAISALVMAVLSLGEELRIGDDGTGIPGPWLLLSRLPLYSSLLESRLAMACVPFLAILLAYGTERALALAPTVRARDVPLRLLWGGMLTAALLPIAPLPFTVEDRPAVPSFFAGGAWREQVAPGRSVVPVPLPDSGAAEPLHWQVRTGLAFPVPEGYFVGPTGQDREGTYGADRRPTSELLSRVKDSGAVPRVTPQQRADAVADLRFWRADVVVLGPGDNVTALRATVEALLGPGRVAGGVIVWDVRGLAR